MKILFLSAAAALLLVTIALGQSAVTPNCGTLDNPCEFPCSGIVTDYTQSQIYYKIRETSVLQADITIVPEAGVDYDLYVSADNPPTISDYLCRPYLADGQEEACVANVIPPSSIYIMVNRYSGNGTFDLSVRCEQAVKAQPIFTYTIDGMTYTVKLAAVARSASSNVALVNINGDTYNLYPNEPVMINYTAGVLVMAFKARTVGTSGGGTADIIFGQVNSLVANG